MDYTGLFNRIQGLIMFGVLTVVAIQWPDRVATIVALASTAGVITGASAFVQSQELKTGVTALKMNRPKL